EMDGTHLAHQAGVEAEPIDAVKDGLRGLRNLLDLDGIAQDEDHVGGNAIVDDWENRRVTHVTAIPIILAINLDRLKQRWQARRGEHGINGYLAVLEHAQSVGDDVACANKELHLVGLAERFEVDLLAEDI